MKKDYYKFSVYIVVLWLINQLIINDWPNKQITKQERKTEHP